jgi:4-hydroxysphinganine ceramide fatty acyl 2-hydroxylase
MKLVLSLLGGIVLLTFLEYVIHRFLGHKKKGGDLVRREHLRHHREGHYFSPMYRKIIAAIIVAAISGISTFLIFGGLGAMFFVVGLIGMYLIYEHTHRVYHIRAPFIKYGLKMRKHHFYHHFKNPNLNHGVTTGFWDRVFGTYHSTRNEQIPVPKSLMLQWLEGEKQNIKEKYKAHFEAK